MERLYDVMFTDLPASMMPQYAWGTTLDEHGLIVNVDRKDAAFATGVVTFTGTVGTVIGTGVQVAVEQSDGTENPVAFATTAGGTIPGGGSIDLPVQATQAGAAANVASGQIAVLLSSVAAPDGTPGISAVTNAAATSGGADVETDDKYRVRVLLEWQSARGGGTVGDYESYALDYPGVGFAKIIPVVQGGGTVAVIVTDEDNKPLGSTTVLGLQNQIDPPSVTSALTANATLPTGTIHCDTTGFDAPNGRVRIGNYVVNYTGVTGSTITGCTGGLGSYLIGEPVYQVGRGNGLAPVGAIVLVWTPAQTSIDVAVVGVYADGYSADGSGGTVSLGDAITAALTAYLDTLAPGDDVILYQAIAQVLLVPGVTDVTSLTLNTTTANVVIDTGHVATAGVIAVT